MYINICTSKLYLISTHYRAQYSQTSVSYSTSKGSDAYHPVHKNTVLYENITGQLLMGHYNRAVLKYFPSFPSP